MVRSKITSVIARTLNIKCREPFKSQLDLIKEQMDSSRESDEISDRIADEISDEISDRISDEISTEENEKFDETLTAMVRKLYY